MIRKLPIYKIRINTEDTGVDYIALTDDPAIEKNFMAFNKFESFSDYPESAKNNAARGIRLNEELGNKCATQVGKVRGQQIANGESLSEDTIKRTYSYLSRAKEYYNPNDPEACGTISYLLWGGEEMLGWCERKISTFKKTFAIQNEEKRIISGPLIVANLPIYRRDEQGEYYVVFDAPTTMEIAQKFFKLGYQNNVNLNHDPSKKPDGVYMFESMIIDASRGISTPSGFETLPDGSWFGSFKVDNDAIWQQVKDGTFTGFSVEGLLGFDYVKETDEDILLEIIDLIQSM